MAMLPHWVHLFLCPVTEPFQQGAHLKRSQKETPNFAACQCMLRKVARCVKRGAAQRPAGCKLRLLRAYMLLREGLGFRSLGFGVLIGFKVRGRV